MKSNNVGVKIYRVNIKHKKGALFISWLFVSSIYLLIFLDSLILFER